MFTNSPAAETRLHWTRQKSTPVVARRRKLIEGQICPLWNDVFKLNFKHARSAGRRTLIIPEDYLLTRAMMPAYSSFLKEWRHW